MTTARLSTHARCALALLVSMAHTSRGSSHYALGWSTSGSEEAPTRLTHTGNLLTFSAAAAILPESRIGLSLMFNASSGVHVGPSRTIPTVVWMTMSSRSLGVSWSARTNRSSHAWSTVAYTSASSNTSMPASRREDEGTDLVVTPFLDAHETEDDVRHGVGTCRDPVHAGIVFSG
ncbi:hypothetical protein [Microbacterium sp. BK668]|uniref:hypothetical protein n=1 Tax=Microbacterium sp. BK668 TaxID=2512118 RepID=UPI00105F00F0|nr:hypothetical protein [Microbacterium sp. BK668]